MPYVLYRAIKGRGARLSDFWSDFAHGEEPFTVQLKEPLEWAGVSTSNDEAQARALAAVLRYQSLAVLEIPDNQQQAIVRQTGKRNRNHHSVMATPLTLLSFVARILPLIP